MRVRGRVRGRGRGRGRVRGTGRESALYKSALYSVEGNRRIVQVMG